MEMEFKRKVKKEVEETVRFELIKCWTVRIISDGNSKNCIAEKDYDYMPSPFEIGKVLSDYVARKCFATVEIKYRLVEALQSIDQLEEVPI